MLLSFSTSKIAPLANSPLVCWVVCHALRLDAYLLWCAKCIPHLQWDSQSRGLNIEPRMRSERFIQMAHCQALPRMVPSTQNSRSTISFEVIVTACPLFADSEGDRGIRRSVSPRGSVRQRNEDRGATVHLGSNSGANPTDSKVTAEPTTVAKIVGTIGPSPLSQLHCWDIELSVPWGDPTLCGGRGVAVYLLSTWPAMSENDRLILSVTVDYEAAFQLILTRVVAVINYFPLNVCLKNQLFFGAGRCCEAE